MADYGASDTSTTSLGTNQFPISEVYVPNNSLTALEGGPVSTDLGGKRSAPVSTYTKDGSDLALGTTTQTKATDGSATSWSVIQLLKGIVDKLLGTLAVTQSGTWNITNVSGTVALPTGASTSAKQPALGTAGTASSDVLSIQGIASMTPVKTDGSGVTQPVSGSVSVSNFPGTQPVSGTVTANAGTGTFTNQQSNVQADYDTGAGTQNVTMMGVALPASGGSVAGGTATNPIRTDPTGTTTQPVSTASLPLPTGAAQEGGNLATLAGVVSGSKAATKAASGDFADGAIVGIGTTTQTKATDGTITSWSVIQLLKGILDRLFNGTVAVTGTFWQATQPVSGTITANQGGSNWTENVVQLNGTTIDTNSGVKSAGTQRVVLATDQPALTNKLLVTPDSVALPAHQSTNVDQLNGTTADTNSGNKSAGTLRVVLATDQPALTNTLLVQDVVASSNGAIPYHNITAATTNFTNVKGAAAQLYGCDLSNTSASAIYVKFYDKATAPGTGDVPKRTLQVPANGTLLRVFPKGLKFVNGFGWAATGAVGDTDNTAIAANCVVDFDLNS